MMADYLRDKYEHQWPLSNKKEQYIADLLEKRLGVKVIAYGAGALSTERFYGKIKNHRAGDPDLKITEYEMFAEVTGPCPLTVSEKDTLWFNQCKLLNALARIVKGEGENTFLVHLLLRHGVKEQILQALAPYAKDPVYNVIKQGNLTDSARCVLGKTCSKVEKGFIPASVLFEKAVSFQKKRNLVGETSELPLIRCIHATYDFLMTYKDKAVPKFKDGVERFVVVPADSKYIISFDDMCDFIEKSGKRATFDVDRDN